MDSERTPGAASYITAHKSRENDHPSVRITQQMCVIERNFQRVKMEFKDRGSINYSSIIKNLVIPECKIISLCLACVSVVDDVFSRYAQLN